MIDEIMPEESDVYSPTGNIRYITAQSYLKGLHHHDRPTDLMPKDALYLKAARRFYLKLSEDDQRIIDSFSDPGLFEKMNLKKRNQRFHKLTLLFICQTPMESQYTFILPPEQAEERMGKNESD